MALMMKDELFSVTAELAIPEVALNGIELAYQTFHVRFARQDRKQRRRSSNKEPLPFR